MTKIAHASILIETKGVRVLSDPWWRGPCFGVQWWVHPKPFLDPLASGSAPVDYIYISHGHHDHLHPGTLVTFPRQTRILVSRALDLADSIRKLGFPVIEVDVDREFDLGGGLRCRIMPTPGSDSLMALTDGEQVCLNLNDALHSASAPVQEKFIRRLRGFYPRIDYVFCGYGTASHFPICYRVPGKDDVAVAIRRQAWFTGQWARIINALDPRFGFPFAADVILLERELFWSNEALHNGESPAAAYKRLHPGSRTQVFDAGNGFCVEDGRVTQDRGAGPIPAGALEAEYGEEIAQANRVRPVSLESMEDLLGIIRGNLDASRAHLSGFPGDYHMRIGIKGAEAAIDVRKRGAALEAVLVTAGETGEAAPDLIYQTRLAYLRNSLTTPYGHEVLFVGSGGIFIYPDRKSLDRGLNKELMSVVTRAGFGTSARASAKPGPAARLKNAVKTVLGIQPQGDLYRVSEWSDLR